MSAGGGEGGGVNIVRDGVIAEHIAVQTAGMDLAQAPAPLLTSDHLGSSDTTDYTHQASIMQ